MGQLRAPTTKKHSAPSVLTGGAVSLRGPADPRCVRNASKPHGRVDTSLVAPASIACTAALTSPSSTML
jgi:hypothetical protein